MEGKSSDIPIPMRNINELVESKMKKGNEMRGLGIAMSSSTFDSLFAGSSCGQGSVKKGWFTMKKLMFAAAVAAGVVCGAEAVSSQVVG